MPHAPLFMQPRQTIIEIFSTFVQFAGDRFSRWAIESSLRRSIQSCIKQAPQETSEYFWTQQRDDELVRIWGDGEMGR
ncbi:hypothetical protein VF12_29060 [Nostoc linckia z15]|nr:hypothetical protein VF12_29060 [Nostoc linckia z15]